MATSERADRLLALDALAVCLPVTEAVNLGLATAVGGVMDVSELLLHLSAIWEAEHRTVACSGVWIPA
nr:hypothetical protein [Tanacetum cinerariifolium]